MYVHCIDISESGLPCGSMSAKYSSISCSRFSVSSASSVPRPASIKLSALAMFSIIARFCGKVIDL